MNQTVDEGWRQLNVAGLSGCWRWLPALATSFFPRNLTGQWSLHTSYLASHRLLLLTSLPSVLDPQLPRSPSQPSTGCYHKEWIGENISIPHLYGLLYSTVILGKAEPCCFQSRTQQSFAPPACSLLWLILCPWRPHGTAGLRLIKVHKSPSSQVIWVNNN